MATLDERRRHPERVEKGPFPDPSDLAGAEVLVVGAGALGVLVASRLVTAGVGRLGMLDPAPVAPPDLRARPIYGPRDVGRPKAEVAAVRIGALEEEALVEAYPVALEPANAGPLVLGRSLVVDCAGESAPVGEACTRAGIPLVRGVAWEQGGEVLALVPGGGCADCEPRAAVGGPAEGSVVGIVAAIAAHEAVRLLAGVPGVDGRALRLDARTGSVESRPAEVSAGCACREGSR